MIPVPGTKAQARVVHEARRTTGNIGDRRNDPCRLMLMAFVPQALLVPWATQVVPGKALVFHAPAGAAALGYMNQACPVATIGVVVSREQGSIVIKGDFLGIAKAGMKDLEV